MSTTNNSGSLDINAIRNEAVEQAFRAAGGKRTLIMTAEFPFMLIGRILQVESDYVFIDVETTHIDPLEDKIFRVHSDRIVSFYIEEPGRPIPHIKSECSCSTKRGDE